MAARQSDTPALPDRPTVDAAWLAANIDHPDVVVIDTRGQVPRPGEPVVSRRDEFVAGHLPGARWIEWNRDLMDPDSSVPNQLAPPARFAAVAGELGIGDGSVVVAYDDDHAIFAARLWWALRAMGHDSVRVLDGGIAAWEAEGCELETGEPAPVEPASFTPRPVAGMRRSIDDVRELVRTRPRHVALLDARSRERFAGTGPDPVGGHVPSARNVPYSEVVTASGSIRTERELRAAFGRARVDPDALPADLVASCGSGVSATVLLLALEHLDPGSTEGFGIYDGSWAEWSSAGDEIATGPDPG